MEEIVTKRLQISGLTPAITPADLSQRLGNFGTIKALDGFGLLDGLGQPRKFGYVTLETTQRQLSRCMNILSGATWKGAKLRIGGAKPDFRERLAKERAPPDPDAEPPTKRRRLPRGVQGVHATDMSLVTPENAASRSGWRVTPTGRLLRTIRMRPVHPLPDPLPTSLLASEKEKATSKKKRKRVQDPPTRAWRRTIDPTRWGAQHLKGAFLESAVVTSAEAPPLQRPGEISESDEDDNDSEVDAQATGNSSSKVVDKLAAVIPESTQPVHPPSPPRRPVAAPQKTLQDSTHNELIREKEQTLGLLQSLFGNRGDDDWAGEEDVDSDIELHDQTGRDEGLMELDIPQDAVEEAPTVPSEVDEQTFEPVREAPKASQRTTQSTKLKDLFAPREEDAGFSLLGHLDLELELDDEVERQIVPESSAPKEAHMVIAAPVISSLPAFDPKRPLFFPITREEGRQGRTHDAIDPTNWQTWFYRTDSAEDIQQRWEEARGELTSTWKRRHREAVKSRRRRGGGPGDTEL